MSEEGGQDVVASAEAEEARTRLGAQFFDGVGCGVAQFRLHHAVAALLGVQVGGVARQPLEVEVAGVARDEGLRLGAAVLVEAVPHDGEGTAHLPAEVAQGGDDVIAGKGTFLVKGSTFGTVSLEMKLPDNTTWVAVGADTTRAADGGGNFELPPSELRVAISGATAVYATVASIE